MDDFQITKEIEVCWGDLDAVQHVNNLIYLRWVETARVEYFMKLNNERLQNDDNIGPVVASQDCKHIRPVNFPDSTIVGVKREEILDDRIVLKTKIFSKKQNRLVAISPQHIVSYDYKRRIKSPLPLNWVYNN